MRDRIQPVKEIFSKFCCEKTKHGLYIFSKKVKNKIC